MENISELTPATAPVRLRINETPQRREDDRPSKVEACGLTREEIRAIIIEQLG